MLRSQDFAVLGGSDALIVSENGPQTNPVDHLIVAADLSINYSKNTNDRYFLSGELCIAKS